MLVTVSSTSVRLDWPCLPCPYWPCQPVLKLTRLCCLALGLSGFTGDSLRAQTPFDSQFLVFDAVPLSTPATTQPLPSAQALGNPAATNIQLFAGGEQAPYFTQELASLPTHNPLPVQVAVQQLATDDVTASANEADIARYETDLKELQLQEHSNAYAEPLTETLLGLATAYETQGNYAAALPLYEQAKHITRVNHGLFSTEQEPIIHRMFNNYLRQGDLVKADEQQAYLFYLQRKIHGESSPNLIPALQTFAEWNIQAFNTDLTAPLVATTRNQAATADSAPITNTTALTIPDLLNFKTQHVITAQFLYLQLLQLLDAHFGASDPRLPATEQAFAVSTYLATNHLMLVDELSTPVASNFDQLPLKTYSFSEGRRALERRSNYLKQIASTAPADLAASRLDIIDWMIATRNRSDIPELFTSAYAEMQATGASAAELDAVFNPALPKAVPSFLVEAYSRQALGIAADSALAYQGYIDVKYSLNALGETTSPQLLFKTQDTPDKVVAILMRQLRYGQFRPRLHAGEVIALDTVYARYYYAY
jgi:hypothetical protein